MLKDGRIGTIFGVAVVARVKVEEVYVHAEFADSYESAFLAQRGLLRRLREAGCSGQFMVSVTDQDPRRGISRLTARGHVLTPDRTGPFDVTVCGGPFSGAVLSLPRCEGKEYVGFVMPDSPDRVRICPMEGGLDGSIYFDPGMSVSLAEARR